MDIDTMMSLRLRTKAANVYPFQAPLGYESPCVIYNRIRTDPTQVLDAEGDDTAYIDYQVDVYSTMLDEAEDLARVIRKDLIGWQDDAIQMVAYTNKTSSVDNTTETQLYRVMTFYKLFATD